MTLSSLPTIETSLLAAAAGLMGIIAGWVFARLGYLKQTSEIDAKARVDIATLTETVRSKTAELAESKSRLEETLTALNTADDQVLELSRQVSAARSRLEQMATLSRDLDRSREEITGLQSEITAQKAHIAEMQTRMEGEIKSASEKIHL
jgi:chromosome segregation ATPase